MTTAEERLAVVESQVSDVRNDVAEIKVDVKALLLRSAKNDGVTQFGKFIIPGAAFLISVAAFIRGG